MEFAAMAKGLFFNDLGRRRGTVGRLGACMLASLATGAIQASNANDLCGATIIENLKLEDDLACTGDGLIVGADGLSINLNGHTVAGQGSGAGIVVTGRRDISIAGGTITAFAVGVRVNASTDVVIKQIEFVGNPEGIDLQSGSIGNTIKGNAFRGSVTRGIMLRSNSSDNDVKHNTFNDNRVGILVFGGADNMLKDNIISGSGLAGIRINVIATGNVVKHNQVTSNVVGIEFLVTATGSATGNEFKANLIETNVCGLKGPTAGNTFIRNRFVGNAVDSCF